MGLNGFIFGDVCSVDYGVFLSAGSAFDGAERDYSMIEIPGRNGALIVENNRWKNVGITYPCFIMRDIASNLPALRAALAAKTGYHRLTDSYQLNEYRVATFAGALEPKMGAANRFGHFNVTFNAKPQRFLVSGETPIAVPASGFVLRNETLFEALPLIKVSGTGGALNIGGTVVQLNTINDFVMLDCDTQNAYKGMTNCNGNISAPVFPVLKPGANEISWSGGIAAVEITPRWWTI